MNLLNTKIKDTYVYVLNQSGANPITLGNGGDVNWNAGGVVALVGNQTIAGVKTFSSTIGGSINGNAATVTNGVYTVGNQTIGGVKTFTNGVISSVGVTGTNLVYNTGNQTIAGVKTFTNGVISSVGVTGTNLVYNTGDQTISGAKTFESTIVGNINGNAETATVAVEANFISDRSNCIIVKTTNNSAIENGDNLLSAYASAKSKSPNGAPKSETNRVTILLPVAKYDLGNQSLVLDTQFIDIIGSTSDRNNHFITSNVGEDNSGTIIQTASNVRLENLTLENRNETAEIQFAAGDVVAADPTHPSVYFPSASLVSRRLKNIKFISNDYYIHSMRVGVSYGGTFIDCASGKFSFGYGGNVSGIFTNCTGGDFSFGSFSGSSSGIFTNCTGGDFSFGSFSGNASGIFTNCTGGDFSFGGADLDNSARASGTFTNCTGGNSSFGGTTDETIENRGISFATGNFVSCIGKNRSFGGGGGSASGNFTNCLGGIDSFGGGYDGLADGTFKNCIGGAGSFQL